MGVCGVRARVLAPCKGVGPVPPTGQPDKPSASWPGLRSLEHLAGRVPRPNMASPLLLALLLAAPILSTNAQCFDLNDHDATTAATAAAG